MKRKTKIILFFSLLILTLFVVLNLINFKNSDENSFEPISNNKEKFIYLFNDTILNKISFESAFGNKNNQIYIYKIDTNFEIIIWNITDLYNVKISNIEMFKNEDFNRISFNPSFKIEWGNPKISMFSIVDKIIAKNIKIHCSINSEIINHIKENDLLFLNLKSNGFAISENDFDYKLKFDFGKKLFVNLAFINDKIGFKIILLKTKNNNYDFQNKIIEILKVKSKSKILNELNS